MEGASANYAKALFDLSLEEGTQDKVLKEVNDINSVFEQNPDLMKVLASKNISKNDKKDLITNVFKKYVSKNVLNFLKLLVDKSRIKLITEICQAYKKAYYKHFNIKELEIYSTVELTKKEIDQIKDAAAQKFNQTLQPINNVDTSLIGGIKIKIDDLVLDGTIANKLDRLKETILNK